MHTKKIVALLLSFVFLVSLGGQTLASEADDSFVPVESVEEIGGSSAASSAAPASSAASTASAGSAASANTSSAAASSKPDTSNLDKQLAELKAQSKQIQGNIDTLRKDKAGEAAVNKEIGAKISNVQTQIDIIDKQIAELDANIAAAETEIENLNATIAEKEEAIVIKQAEYDTSFSEFKTRLVAMYIAGDTSTLEVLLSAEDFSDMLSSTEYLRFIAEKDRQIMEDLLATKNDIIAEKALVEENKTQVETHKTQMDADRETAKSKRTEQAALRADLKKLKEESDYELYNINEELKGKETEKKLVDAEAQKIEAEIQKLISDGADPSAPYVGGDMAWPVPGAYHVSMPYMGYKGHTGMDITTGSSGSVNGMTVVAANGGTVIATIRGYTGYGHYVIIDHGGGTTTLYAHLSSISVSKGTKVSRGQAIGAVGSTGNSTGPHLHFEVRINGKHTNPIGYVKAK